MRARRTIGMIAAAALLGACGGDDSGFADQEPAEIVAAAERDMKALSSLRMTGDLVADGEEVSIDMTLSTDGDCEGTIGQGGATAELISLDGTSYMKPDAAFWELFAGDAASMLIEVVGDRWVMLPADEGDFSEFCDLDVLLDEIDEDETDRALEVEGTEEIDSRDAVRIATTTDEGDPLTVWVATEEPHVIVQMEVVEGEEPGLVRFSEFDEELDIEAPPQDEVFDLAELG